MKGFCIILLGSVMVMAIVSLGSAADINNASKIIIQGDGKVNAAPDQAIIILGVETRNISASVAATQNAELMNKTINALLATGINKSDIQTSTYSLSIPAPNDQLAAVQTGNTTKPPEFVATNQVTVMTNNTSGLGKILDAAIAAGSNNVQSINFQLRDPKPQMDRALALAIADAQRKAQVIAKAAGVKIGRVLEISGGYSYAAPAARYDLVSAAAPTPVLPGQMEVTASISMTYEIS
ncbi:MAG: SIMPL domain-containing protein [Methanotrichaceae archaeon]